MGNHLAPPLAIVFMDRLEQTMLQTAAEKPDLYDRYVDDCLMVWSHGEAKLLQFIEHCNRQHPSISFTWESSLHENSVSYMDLAISIKGEQLEYELYQKPSDSGVNINYKSSILRHVKLAVATEQFSRAKRLSSNPEARSRSDDKIRTLLRDNEFPADFVDAAKERSDGTRRRKTQDGCDTVVTLTLPFCSDDLDKAIRRRIRKSKLPVRVVYERTDSLKTRLVRSALLPKSCAVRDRFLKQQQQTQKHRGQPCDDCLSCQAGIRPSDCEKRGAIYLLRCKLCSETYIGESQRAIRTRLKEHHLHARNRYAETPWGEHMQSHPEHSVSKEPVFTARILALEHTVATRRLREAIEIREYRPAINRNSGWTIN